MRIKIFLATFLFFLFTVHAVSSAETEKAGDAILGLWITEGGKSHVEVVKHKDEETGESVYSGSIVWLSEPNFSEDDVEAGKPVRDRENPDPEKQNDPILGLKIIKGFTYSGDNIWRKGTVYDPENGKTYKCKITLVDGEETEDGEVLPQELHVRGYIGLPALGRTTTWKRYIPEDKK